MKLNIYKGAGTSKISTVYDNTL